VRTTPDWLPNPLLPDTCSEMAVPITLGVAGQVIGVLDVQEDEIAGLDEGDASLLRTLAAQVAVAIRGDRLLAESKIALTEARIAQEKYVEQVWDKARIIQQGAEHLYLRTATAAPLSEAMLAEAKQLALAQDQPALVAIRDNSSDSHLPGRDKRALGQSIVAPVKLVGKKIGVLQMHRPDATEGADFEVHSWTDEDLALLEAVIDQLAQSAENIRLFEDTRERAGREQTIREITDKLRAAPNLERLVEIATEELGQRLATTHAKLELGIDTKSNGLE